MFKKLITLFSVLAILLSLTVIPSSAENIAPAQKLNITLSGTGYSSFGFLKDGNIKTYKTSSGSCSITIDAEENIYSLYFSTIFC